MPIAMSPIRPNPPPATILPASQPAISPTSRTTRRLSPEMCMAPPHQNRALLLSGPDNSDGTSWVPEFLAEQPSQQCPLWVTCGRRLGKNFLTLLQHLVGCGHVSGLFVRRIWPLALMLCADRVPIESTHFKVR